MHAEPRTSNIHFAHAWKFDIPMFFARVLLVTPPCHEKKDKRKPKSILMRTSQRMCFGVAINNISNKFYERKDALVKSKLARKRGQKNLQNVIIQTNDARITEE